MRSANLKCYFLAFLSCISSVVFAQGDNFQRKLDSLKEKNNLAEWLYERMDYVTLHPQQGLSYLVATQKKAWRAAKSTDEHFAWVNLLSSLGYYRLLDGNILGSIDYYETAFDYYLKYKVADYDAVEYILKPLSNNYTRLGDYERALYLQQRTLNFQLKRQDPPEKIAAIYSNMAISYRSMGNFSEAEKSINAGLKLVKPNDLVTLSLNNILSDILLDQQQYAKAARLIESNIAKQKTVNQTNAYWLMSANSTAGTVYLALNNPAKADGYFAKAINILDRYLAGTRLREKANLFTQRGRVKLLQNQPALAIGFFNQTLSILKIIDSKQQLSPTRIYGDNKLVEVFEQRATAYLLLKNPTAALQNISFALLAADKIRQEFGADQTKERLQADLKHIVEKGIEISYQLYQKNKDQNLLNEILKLAEQSKAKTLLDQINSNQQFILANLKDPLFTRKQALERAIVYNEKQALEEKENLSNKTTASLKYDLALINKQIKQKYRQFNVEHDIQVSTLLTALPKQRIIEYFVGKNAIYLIDISNKKINAVVKIDDANSIRLAIQNYSNTYFQHGPSAMLNAPKAFYQASNQLFQSILKGVQFAKNESVIIVPDEVLGYISFDGLITSDQYQPNISKWPFLIKNNAITYAFSLQTLTLNKVESSNKHFTGLFITHEKNSNQPLKAVQNEADGIKKLVKGDFLFNNEVNAKKFNQVFEESNLLHIGTHAYLSGKSQEPTLDFGKEKVFLFELGAKKHTPSLVVLSACKTADGQLANGEGIISLSRGFNAIGTPATIASLWNVNDVAASIITTNFYKHLLKDRSSGMALHQAKIDWLNSPQSADAFYLPYYWDSLIYMGADQHIELQQAMPNGVLLVIGLSLVLVTIGFLRYRKRVKS